MSVSGGLTVSQQKPKCTCCLIHCPKVSTVAIDEAAKTLKFQFHIKDIFDKPLTPYYPPLEPPKETAKPEGKKNL